jgi:hypothetical protein
MHCYPTPYCSCCECQGKYCFVAHPGHSHRGGLMSPVVFICEDCGTAQVPRVGSLPNKPCNCCGGLLLPEFMLEEEDRE